MKNNIQLQKDVSDELQFEPALDPAEIGVAVADGIVTLSGKAKSYAEKWSAVRAAERVEGVKAVVDEIEVLLPYTYHRTDEDIARAVLHALEWDVIVPDDRIKVHVENGWIILKGTVDHKFQQNSAEDAIRNLAGVRGITNHIKVTPRVVSSAVKTTIENALRRAAESEAKQIRVDVTGSKVTLRGTIHSWNERHEATRAAWSTPGVAEVHDELVVT